MKMGVICAGAMLAMTGWIGSASAAEIKVMASAAIHDAYGKAHGVNCFRTYGPEFMSHDLSYYLGAAYEGEYPSQYIRSEPKARMPLCHLISAVDPIEEADNTRPIRDGLPETLPEWINLNGLKYFKIKLNGNDLKWDLERVLHIDRVTTQTQKKRGRKDWAYVLDFNEKCPNVDYYLTFLRRLKDRLPEGFARVEYVEQPTARDLAAHPENAMHQAAKLCPVVIDESLIDVDSLLLARKLGWSGAVVKSPKGLTHMILVACVAGKQRLFVAGGDMTWFQDMIDDPRKFRALGPEAKRIITSLLELEKPIVCRLNGAAAGLGASLALLCDIIVADETALIGDPHVKVGLVAGE